MKIRTIISLMVVLYFSITPCFGDAYETLIEKGDASIGEHEYDKAIVYLTAAINLKPNLPVAYDLRGLAYSHNGQYEKAIADLDRAIEILPGNAWQHSIRGLAFFFTDQHDKAISDFTKAIETDPDFTAHSNLYLNRGKAHAAVGQLDKAISDFNSYVRINPDHASQSDPYFHRGRAYWMKGEYEKAISDLNIAIAKKTQGRRGYSLRGLAFKFQGQYHKRLCLI